MSNSPYRILRVGDPHVKISNLEDCRKLIDFAVQTAKSKEVGVVEFLGDLFHNHDVKRVKVERFWMDSFKKLKENELEVRVLVGNHDMSNSGDDSDTTNALDVFIDYDLKYKREIINKPKVIDGIAYVPYMKDEGNFISACKALYDLGAEKTLIAHQTFTGSVYENGFYAEESIDPASIPQQDVVSGHIHKRQQIGKCFYPGTPKWDTMSDANEEKGLWVFTHSEDGSIIDKEFISTEEVVTPIRKYVVSEGDEIPVLKKNCSNYVELVGKSSWIKDIRAKLKGKAKVKAKPIDRKVVNINKNSLASVESYLNEVFEPCNNVNKNLILEYIKELNGRQEHRRP